MRKIFVFVIFVFISLSFVACKQNINSEFYCFKCGKEIVKSDVFCSHCGVNLNESSNIVSQQPTTSETKGYSNKSSTIATSQESYSSKIIDLTSVQTVPTSSSNDEELQRQLFQQLYNNQKSLYLMDISNQLDTLNNELKQIQELSSQNTAEYFKNKKQLTEQFANMGLLDSGAYKTALNNLEQNYNSKVSEISTQTKKLQNDISILSEEKNNPNYLNILNALAKNNNMTYAQVLEKYNKYILN